MAKDLKQYLNQGISSPLALGIIVVIAAIVGLTIWYIGNTQVPEPTSSPTPTPSPAGGLTPSPSPTSDQDLTNGTSTPFQEGLIGDVTVSIQETGDKALPKRLIYQDNYLSYQINYPNDWDYCSAYASSSGSVVTIVPQALMTVEEVKESKQRGGIGPGYTFEISHRNRPLTEELLDEMNTSNEIWTTTVSRVKISGIDSYCYMTEYKEWFYGREPGDITFDYFIPLDGRYILINLMNYRYLDVLKNMFSTFSLHIK